MESKASELGANHIVWWLHDQACAERSRGKFEGLGILPRRLGRLVLIKMTTKNTKHTKCFHHEEHEEHGVLLYLRVLL